MSSAFCAVIFILNVAVDNVELLLCFLESSGFYLGPNICHYILFALSQHANYRKLSESAGDHVVLQPAQLTILTVIILKS